MFNGFLPKKEETKDYFFSLYLDVDAAAVAVWNLDATGVPHVASFAHAVVADDSWDSRIQVIDRLLSAAEDKVGVTKPITKTVFGMPGAYLTSDGNITSSVRPQLQKLTKMLELTPVGFVPLYHAIAFSIKKEEGVPSSAILLGCSGNIARLSLFRVGQLTHDDMIVVSDDPAQVLEAELKKIRDSDVLPSRILLYGGNTAVLESTKSKLLKHPWPQRANFLHFPKVEIITVEALLTAVSLAGASELAQNIGENTAAEDAEAEDAEVVSTVVAQPGAIKSQPPTASIDDGLSEEEASDDAGGEDEEEVSAEADSADGGMETDNEDEPVEDEEDEGEEEEISGDGPSDEELSNVEVVTPESLGFRHEDVLEHVEANKTAPRDSGGRKPSFTLPMKVKLPAIQFDLQGTMRNFMGKLPRGKGKLAVVAAVIIGLLLLGFAMYYTLPKATVTVLVASSSVDESTVVSVDPKSTVADPSSKIIPGKTQEQSVSGEKTIAVTGKKNIGDPAKGTVTIYNKVTSGRTFPKGTSLTTGGIAFTLDSDVSVASASETIGSITFGKTTANVTAKEIGPNGNVGASSEFTFANVSATSVSARNETAFTGGTSKQVTVVSRADQDALVEAITGDLVTQAKQQLLTSGASGDRLIDATVKTTVSEKVFSAELNQEAKELNGKVTVTVTGVSIADSDIKAVLSSLVSAKVPSGYRLAPEQTNVTTSNVTVKKDGTITLTAKLTAVSLPEIDEEGLKTKLVGKPINEATAILRETNGVAGAEYFITRSPNKSRLPSNRNNITITVMVQ